MPMYEFNFTSYVHLPYLKHSFYVLFRGCHIAPYTSSTWFVRWCHCCQDILHVSHCSWDLPICLGIFNCQKINDNIYTKMCFVLKVPARSSIVHTPGYHWYLDFVSLFPEQLSFFVVSVGTKIKKIMIIFNSLQLLFGLVPYLRIDSKTATYLCLIWLKLWKGQPNTCIYYCYGILSSWINNKQVLESQLVKRNLNYMIWYFETFTCIYIYINKTDC